MTRRLILGALLGVCAGAHRALAQMPWQSGVWTPAATVEATYIISEAGDQITDESGNALIEE